MRSFVATMALLWAGSEARSNKGSCQDNPVEGKKAFKEDRFDGRWFEIAKDKDFYDPNASCANEDFVKNFDGSVTVARNSYTLEDGWTQKQINAVINKNKRGEYGLCDAEEGCLRDITPHFVYLATDYEEWAVEYVCIDIVPGRYYVDSVSIKARTPQIDESTIELVTSLVESSIPGYEFENLFFIHQCDICPFDSVPSISAN